MKRQPSKDECPLVAMVDAAREAGVQRAVLLTEQPDGSIAMRSVGDWNGLEFRGLAVMMCEIVSGEDAGDGEDD